MYSRLMQSLLSPRGVYTAADVDVALTRVFGMGVRPLHLESALFEAMLSGWRSQQAARYLKAKTIRSNEVGVRRFQEQVGCWPWEWRASHVDEYFEDLLVRPERLARATLRAQRVRERAAALGPHRTPKAAIAATGDVCTRRAGQRFA